jgi:hypothetical protein
VAVPLAAWNARCDARVDLHAKIPRAAIRIRLASLEAEAATKDDGTDTTVAFLILPARIVTAIPTHKLRVLRRADADEIAHAFEGRSARVAKRGLVQAAITVGHIHVAVAVIVAGVITVLGRRVDLPLARPPPAKVAHLTA